MQRNFVQVAKFLEEQFPELKGNIVGGVNPPLPIIVLLQNIISVCQLIGIVWMIIGGERILQLFGYTTNSSNRYPKLYYIINNNPMPIMVMLFLILPQIINSFSVNGAFEIYLNDNTQPIFSKLQLKRFPDADTLIQSFTNAGLKQQVSSITTSQ